MRLIHTSDWHLGQHFFTKNRSDEHRAFMHWLIAQVEQYHVDTLLIAGDLFDTSSPPSYARELYNHFIVELQRTGCHLVILAGNHDSVATLNESRELLGYLNTTVVASPHQDVNQDIHLLMQRDGKPGALLCAIPFIRPRDLLISQVGESGKQKQLALQQAIAHHYQQLYLAACRYRDELALDLPIIATGHLATVGAHCSDSVRDIYIGTLNAFPVNGFPAADYTALGHIHRAQTVAHCHHIRYSGSPIALSFDEADQAKSVFLVEFAGGKLKQIDTLEIPCFQPMQTIKGDLAHIAQQLQSFSQFSGKTPLWLDIEIASQDYHGNIQQRIQQLTKDLPVEVLLLRRSRKPSNQTLTGLPQETLNELTVNEVFERRLRQENTLEKDQCQRLQQLFCQVTQNIAQGKEPSA